MHAVSKTNSTQIKAPSLITRPMADLIAKFTNRLEDKPGDFRRKLLSASLAPAGAEREALEARRGELRRSLTPTPGADADDVIFALLAGSNTFGMTERETNLKVRLYAEALADQPTWTIEKARQLFAKGGFKSPWNGQGAPSSANVVAECKLMLLPVEEELYRISQILDAELVDRDTTADERALNVAEIARLIADLKSGTPQNERLLAEAKAERAAKLQAAVQVQEGSLNAQPHH